MAVSQVLDTDLERCHDHKDARQSGSDDMTCNDRLSHAARDMKSIDSVLFMKGLDGALLIVA